MRFGPVGLGNLFSVVERTSGRLPLARLALAVGSGPRSSRDRLCVTERVLERNASVTEGTHAGNGHPVHGNEPAHLFILPQQ